jgi:Tfp pilus assembly protein PilZ
MADRIQFRRDTAARWSQYNPILLEGEIGVVTDNPNQYKIGDGVHAWILLS